MNNSFDFNSGPRKTFALTIFLWLIMTTLYLSALCGFIWFIFFMAQKFGVI